MIYTTYTWAYTCTYMYIYIYMANTCSVPCSSPRTLHFAWPCSSHASIAQQTMPNGFAIFPPPPSLANRSTCGSASSCMRAYMPATDMTLCMFGYFHTPVVVFNYLHFCFVRKYSFLGLTHIGLVYAFLYRHTV